MVYTRKSRKLLFVATALTITSLASLLTVYAAVLGTFNGNAFTVNKITSGAVTYSTDGSTGWSTSPSAFNVGDHLYSRFELSSTSYSGSANLTWQLQQDNSGWTNVGSPLTTTVLLSVSNQTIYASANGLSANNHDWGDDISTGRSYRVTATITTA
jgi:hypothetical protein